MVKNREHSPTLLMPTFCRTIRIDQCNHVRPRAGVQDSVFAVNIQNAYRGYTIVIDTTPPEDSRFVAMRG